MTSRGIVPSCLFAALVLPSFLLAQSVADDIEAAIGGRSQLEANKKYVVTGTLDRVVDTPEGPVREVAPFRLAFDGDLSRFEFSNRTIIRQGVLQQWWKQGGERSSVRIGWQGLREIYLMPVWPILQLKSIYELTETGVAADVFQRLVTTRRFIGKRNKTDVVELAFHPQTHLLAEALITTVDNKRAPTLITYEDYTEINGLMLPSKVTRTIGDNSPWIFLIESVDFSPTVRSDEFDFEYRTQETKEVSQ